MAEPPPVQSGASPSDRGSRTGTSDGGDPAVPGDSTARSGGAHRERHDGESGEPGVLGSPQ